MSPSDFPLLSEADSAADVDRVYYRAQHIAQPVNLQSWRQFVQQDRPSPFYVPHTGNTPLTLSLQDEADLVNEALDEESIWML
jgi:hypothetical protein